MVKPISANPLLNGDGTAADRFAELSFLPVLRGSYVGAYIFSSGIEKQQFGDWDARLFPYR
jgi:hypothetical protein